MRLSGKLAVATAIAGAVSLLIPSSSYAVGASVVAVTGSGTISPGLDPLVSNTNTVTFGGTAVGVAAGTNKPLGSTTAAADAGQVTCTFSGGTNGFENSGLGQGTVGGGCSGTGLLLNTTVSVSCSALAYDRVGTLVVVYGDGHPHTTVDSTGVPRNLASAKCTVTATGPLGTVTQTLSVYGVFNFVPTSVLPTDDYVLTGLAVGLPLNQIFNTL